MHLDSNGLISKLPGFTRVVLRSHVSSSQTLACSLATTAYCEQTRPHTSLVTFNCLLLSSQRAQHRANLNTPDSGTGLGIREANPNDQSSLVGHVWVWQHKQRLGYSLIPIPSDCDSRTWGMGEGQRVVELEASSLCKRLTEALNKDTKWWVLVSYQ